MAISKRKDGKWLVNIKPGGRVGKQIKRVFNTEREAKQFVIWANGQALQDPDWAPIKKDTRRLSKLIERWFELHGCKLRDGKKRLGKLRMMCLGLGDPIASQFKAFHFSEYRAARLKNGISDNTVNHEHAHLRSVFNELRRLGEWTEPNPIESVKALKLQEQEMGELSSDQIQILMAALDGADNKHVKLIATVCLSTGARWGEAESLNISQVKDGLVLFANETKSRKARGIPISTELEEELRSHHKKHGEGQKIFGPAYSAFRRALDRTEIPMKQGQASHVLRHTFASEFMRRGGNILVLQRALGHQSLAMTMRYAHMAPDHLIEVRTLNPMAKK
ncbi:MAG: integrase [Comamonadaceae bacterium PBBC2]|nr:MAG: integrase [Comamonadaceae bacterium PBBC2]